MLWAVCIKYISEIALYKLQQAAVCCTHTKHIPTLKKHLLKFCFKAKVFVHTTSHLSVIQNEGGSGSMEAEHRMRGGEMLLKLAIGW